ncbi:helix-turn-helix domain-containing protein [Nocardia asiatica]
MSWQAVNWVLYHSDVDDYVEFRVLMLLANRADPDGTGAWPTQEELSTAVRRSDRTIRRALKSLREAGHIRFGDQKRVPGTANHRPRAYDIIMSGGAVSEPPADESGWTTDVQTERTQDVHPKDSGRTPVVQTGWTSDVQVGRTSGDHITILSTTHLSETTQQRDARQSPLLAIVPNPVEAVDEADPFDRFWDEFPKHAKRDEARAEWDNAIAQGTDPETIIEGARRFAADPETQRLMNSPQERRFVPFARTWLKDRAWKDWGTPLRKVSGDPYSQPVRRPFNPNWQEI